MSSEHAFSPYFKVGVISDPDVNFAAAPFTDNRDVMLATCIGANIQYFRGSDLSLLVQSDSLLACDESDRIRCIEIGHRLTFIAVDRRVRVLCKNGQLLMSKMDVSLDHPIVALLVFDYEHLLVLDSFCTLHVWNYRDNSIDRVIPVFDSQHSTAAPAPLLFHPATYVNKVLVSSGERVRLVNIKHGRTIYEFKFEAAVRCFCQSSVVDVVAVGLESGSCLMFDLARDLVMFRFEHEHGPLLSVGFRPDARKQHLITAGAGFMACWDLNERRHLFQSVDLAYTVRKIRFLPGIPVFVVGSDDNALRQFMVDESGKFRLVRELLGNPGAVQHVRFVRGQKLVATSGNRVFSYALKQSNRPYGFEVAHAALKHNKERPPIIDVSVEACKQEVFDNIVCLHRDDTAVTTMSSMLLRPDAGGFLLPKRNKSDVFLKDATCSDISECGSFALIGYSNHDPIVVAVFNLQAHELRNVYKLGGEGQRLLSVHFAKLNKELIVCTNRSVIKHPLSDQKVSVLRIDGTGITAKTQLLRERSFLAAPSADRLLLIDTDRLQIVRIFSQKADFIRNPRFSADYNLVMAVSGNLVRVWAILTGCLVDTLTFPSPIVTMDTDDTDLMAIVTQNSRFIEVLVNTFSYESLKTPLKTCADPNELRLNPYGPKALRSLIYADLIRSRCAPLEPSIKKPTEAPFFLPSTADIAELEKKKVAETTTTTKKRKAKSEFLADALSENTPPEDLFKMLESLSPVNIANEIENLDTNEISRLLVVIKQPKVQSLHFELCVGIVSVLNGLVAVNGTDELKEQCAGQLKTIALELDQRFEEIRNSSYSCMAVISFLRMGSMV